MRIVLDCGHVIFTDGRIPNPKLTAPGRELYCGTCRQTRRIAS